MLNSCSISSKSVVYTRGVRWFWLAASLLPSRAFFRPVSLSTAAPATVDARAARATRTGVAFREAVLPARAPSLATRGATREADMTAAMVAGSYDDGPWAARACVAREARARGGTRNRNPRKTRIGIS